jgi:hypothetical protein
MAKDMMQPPDSAYAYVGDVDPQRIWVWKETAVSGDRAMLDGWKRYYPAFDGALAAIWKTLHGVSPDKRPGYIFLGTLKKEGEVYVVPPWVDADIDRPNVLYIAGDIMSLAEWELRARAARDKDAEGTGSPWLWLVLAWLALR